jgi:hypothetical protein
VRVHLIDHRDERLLIREAGRRAPARATRRQREITDLVHVVPGVPGEGRGDPGFTQRSRRGRLTARSPVAVERHTISSECGFRGPGGGPG